MRCESFKNFYLSENAFGHVFIRPFRNYHNFFNEKSRQPGCNKGLWAVAHLVTGVVVYPLALVGSLIGLLLNGCDLLYVWCANRKALLICRAKCEVIIDMADRDHQGVQITFNRSERADIPNDTYMGMLREETTPEKQREFHQKVVAFVSRHYTSRFLKVREILTYRCGGTYNQIQRWT